MENRKAQLVPHSPLWKKVFEKESQTLEKLLRKNLVSVHHIGSTAIRSILAKPTLDIMCIVHTLDGIEMFEDEFRSCGFQSLSGKDTKDRLIFQRTANNGSDQLTNVYVFERGNGLINDYLDFRDYLIAEVEVAKSYENLKVTLKKEYPLNQALYQKGKAEFIQTVLKNIR